MKLHQFIRYIGLFLLTVSFVAMLGLYLYSYSGMDQIVGNLQNTSVILVTEGEVIPQIELRAIFRRMGLSFTTIQISGDSDYSQKQTELDHAILSNPSEKVILLATQKSAYSSLVSVASSEKLLGLILLAPDISSSEDLSAFGARNPAVPTVFLAPDDDYVRTLYERLSGEDAQLFLGIKENTILPYEVYTSPDGRRYLSVWSGLDSSSISKTLFSFVPGVTAELGSVIGTHILGDAKLAADARFTAQTVRSVISWSSILSIAGLFFFISSIPTSRKRPLIQPPDSLPQVEGADSSIPLPEEQVSMIPDIFLDPSTRLRYKKKTIAIEFLFGALATVIMVVLYFIKREFSIYIVASWPVFYYAFLLTYLPSRANTLLDRRVPRARHVMSSIVVFLFFATFYSLILSVRPDPVRTTLSVRMVAGLTVSLALFFFVKKSMMSGIVFCTEAWGKDVFSQENKLWTLGLRALIFLPALIHLLLSVFSGDTIGALSCVIFLLFILMSAYLRYAFRTIGGTAKAGAFAFSAFLMVVMFL